MFDQFATKLTTTYHVYGITRRGFGASGVPSTGYLSDRLGDDVLAVLDSLRLKQPILAGHSLAGEEMSSIGSRHPERVAALIYLEAGYSYAYYDRSRGDMQIDVAELLRVLPRLQAGAGTGPRESAQLALQLLDTSLPMLQRDLRDFGARLATGAAQPNAARFPAPFAALYSGMQPYTEIHVPVLGIYAIPHKISPEMIADPAARAAARATDSVATSTQSQAFEHGIPAARVIRLSNADHFVFNSNEADVLREMRAFITSLPEERPTL